MGKEPLTISRWEHPTLELINRQIFCIAQSRSGTGSICELFARLGVDSYHEIAGSPEDVFNITKAIISENRPSFIQDNIASFDIVAQLEKECPSLRFFVLIRDPVAVCNSQRHTLRKGINPHYTDDLRHYTDGWITKHISLCHQIEEMDHKPLFIEFDEYIKDKFNRIFLAIFGIPENTYIHLEIQRHLLKRINTNNEYQKEWMGDFRYSMCMEVWDKLKELCRNSWVKEEFGFEVPW